MGTQTRTVNGRRVTTFEGESNKEFTQRQKAKLKARRSGDEALARKLQRVRGSKAVQRLKQFADIKVSQPELVEITRRIKTKGGEIIEGFTKADIVKRESLKRNIERLNNEAKELERKIRRSPTTVDLTNKGVKFIEKVKKEEKKFTNYINQLRKTKTGKKAEVFINKQKQKFGKSYENLDVKRKKIVKKNIAQIVKEKQRLESKKKLNRFQKKKLKNLENDKERLETYFTDKERKDMSYAKQVGEEIIGQLEKPVITGQAFLSLSNKERRTLVVGGLASVPALAIKTRNKVKKELVDFVEASPDEKKTKLRNVARAVVEGSKSPEFVAEASTGLFVGITNLFGKKVAKQFGKKVGEEVSKVSSTKVKDNIVKKLANKKKRSESTKAISKKIKDTLTVIKKKQSKDNKLKKDINAKIKKKRADLKSIKAQRRKRFIKRKFIDALDEFDFDDDDDDKKKKKDDDDDDDDDDKKDDKKKKSPIKPKLILKAKIKKPRIKPKFRARTKLRTRVRGRAQVRPELKIIPFINLKKKVSKTKKVSKKKVKKGKDLIKFTPTLFDSPKSKKKKKGDGIIYFTGLEERA